MIMIGPPADTPPPDNKICHFCRPWCATTEAQLANRRKNMADVPSASLYACPKCNGTDWAMTRRFIMIIDQPANERRPWWKRMFGK